MSLLVEIGQNKQPHDEQVVLVYKKNGRLQNAVRPLFRISDYLYFCEIAQGIESFAVLIYLNKFFFVYQLSYSCGDTFIACTFTKRMIGDIFCGKIGICRSCYIIYFVKNTYIVGLVDRGIGNFSAAER